MVELAVGHVGVGDLVEEVDHFLGVLRVGDLTLRVASAEQPLELGGALGVEALLGSEQQSPAPVGSGSCLWPWVSF